MFHQLLRCQLACTRTPSHISLSPFGARVPLLSISANINSNRLAADINSAEQDKEALEAESDDENRPPTQGDDGAEAAR